MVTNSIRTFLLIAFVLCVSFMAFSQKETVRVYGMLKDETTKKKLENVSVVVYKDGSQHDNFDTGNSGKYDLALTLGYTYDIKFAKDGYLQKIIRIDSRNIPEEERYGGFQFPMDGTLFPMREGFNTDLLKEPLALIKYDSQNDGLNYDEKYGSDKREKILAEHKRLDDLAKNYEKLKKQFDDLLKEGDKKMAETKYSDALEKFQGALNIFPKDETAKAKYNDAKARVDAENANKEFEAKYAQLMIEGQKLFDDNKYEEAKKKFQEANKMKEKEVQPKEMIYKCEEALKDSAKRKEYDAIIADADKKFDNKDYAVSIEKYKEASNKLPKESYPKDQIVRAELALKSMLDDEAAKLAKRRDYEAKVLQADSYYKEDNLEKSISAYREAGFILPEEKLPQEKINEIEKILAERKKQSEALAKDNSDKERREKEYNDMVKIADDLFVASKFTESREKYVMAQEIKPDASWPKSRIERIDQMLSKGNADLANARRKAYEDSLAAAKLASLDAVSRRKMELQMRQEEQAASRRQHQEDKRIAAYQKISESKEKNWSSQADAEAEDEVEQYYRDAKSKEDAARNNEVRQRVLENNSFHERKSNSQSELIAQREEEIQFKQSTMTALSEKGEIQYAKQNVVLEQKKKDAENQDKGAKQSADSRQSRDQKSIEIQQKTNNEISQNDRQRSMRVAENESEKKQVRNATEDAQRHGDVLRKDNQNAISKKQEEQKENSFRGEIVRQEKEDEIADKVKTQQRVQNDMSKAANEKLKNTSSKIEERKEQVQSNSADGGIKTTAKANEIAKQKAELDLQKKERELAETQKHFEKYNEANNVKTGPKKPAEGSENLAEGVTENSYKLGNKMITERKVTIGNQVNTYKKVVSKTAIYYFKNGTSITETAWKMETLSNK